MDTFMILGACIAGASVVGYILFENKKNEKEEPLKLSYNELGDKENSFHFNYAFTKTKNKPDFLLKKVIGVTAKLK